MYIHNILVNFSAVLASFELNNGCEDHSEWTVLCYISPLCSSMSIDPSKGFEQSIKHVLDNNLSTDDSVDFRVFVDGSVSTDGKVGLGWVVCDSSGKILCKGSRKFVVDKGSTQFANKAEWLAIKASINQLQSMDWFGSEIKIYSDNQSVVEAFSRPTKLWSDEMFNSLRQRVDSESVEWIQRDYNKVADAVAKNARKKITT